MNYALAPGILDSTLDRSTPVSALMAGGSDPTKRVTSAVQLSLPPINTISSVLASGAAISAAIFGMKKKETIKLVFTVKNANSTKLNKYSEMDGGGGMILPWVVIPAQCS